MSDEIKRALDAAAQSWCCGDAACHYNDCGLPCEARDHARMGQAIAAFLRALHKAQPGVIAVETSGKHVVCRYTVHTDAVPLLAAAVEGIVKDSRP